MAKKGFLDQFFKRSFCPVVMVLILLLTTSILSGADENKSWVKQADKSQVAGQVAGDWIEVGKELYGRRFYQHAEESFLHAQDYREYLSAFECENLKALLEESQNAQVQRQLILNYSTASNKLIEQRQYRKAREQLEKIKDSEFLRDHEREIILKKLAKVNSYLDMQKEQITEIYEQSVNLYQKGELEQARGGFTKIDNILARRAEPLELQGLEIKGIDEPNDLNIEDSLLDAIDGEAAGPAEKELLKESDLTVIVDTAESVTKESSLDVLDISRKNIVRSYTQAVVNDAVAKAMYYLGQGKFENAKKESKTAEQTLNENKRYLNNDVVSEYRSKLQKLNEKIAQSKAAAARY